MLTFGACADECRSVRHRNPNRTTHAKRKAMHLRANIDSVKAGAKGILAELSSRLLWLPANVYLNCGNIPAIQPVPAPIDIREIAKRARVSTATVSRTINRVPTVDPQLAKRVWKVVDELGYFPNTQARALVSGKSRIFGLIVSEITNPFFPEIVQSFEDLAVQHNYEILLTSTVYDPKRMESSVRRMIERRVDGVAILTFGMEDSLL